MILDLLSHRFERARELYADHWLGFSEVELHQLLEEKGFKKIEVTVVSREKESPHFQTVFATGIKGDKCVAFFSEKLLNPLAVQMRTPNCHQRVILRGLDVGEKAKFLAVASSRSFSSEMYSM